MLANELWFIYALVFGAALLGVQGLYWVLFKARQEKQAINRRLVLGTQLANPSEVLEAFRKERSGSFLGRFFHGGRSTISLFKVVCD